MLRGIMHWLHFLFVYSFVCVVQSCDCFRSRKWRVLVVCLWPRELKLFEAQQRWWCLPSPLTTCVITLWGQRLFLIPVFVPCLCRKWVWWCCPLVVQSEKWMDLCGWKKMWTELCLLKTSTFCFFFFIFRISKYIVSSPVYLIYESIYVVTSCPHANMYNYFIVI